MKAIKFICPHCGQRISGTKDLVGKSGKCPRCLSRFVLEAPLLISSSSAQDGESSPPERNRLLVPLIGTSTCLLLTSIAAVVYFFHRNSPAGSTTSAGDLSATPVPLPLVQATPVPAAPPPEPAIPKIADRAPAPPTPVHAADGGGAIALAPSLPPLPPPKPVSPKIAASAPATPAPAPPAPATPTPTHGSGDAGAILLAQTPPAVQRTVLANVGNGKVTSISMTDEDSVAIYEVAFTKDGQPRDLHVGKDGRLLSILIALADTPPAVRKSIQSELEGDTLVAIEKTFEVDETSYLVEITARDGRARRFTIGDDGVLSEREIGLSEAPAPVQKTVAAQVGDGTLKILTKIFAEKVTYDADFTKDGKDGAVSVAGNGQLLSVKITLAEATAAAQQTILAKVGAGRIRSVWKSFEKRENVFPFKVESVKDGKLFNFSVGPNGRFLGVDD